MSMAMPPLWARNCSDGGCSSHCMHDSWQISPSSPAADPVAQRAQLGDEAPPVPDLQQYPGLGGRPGRREALLGPDADRLLAQHRDAGRGEPRHQRRVLVRGRRDQHPLGRISLGQQLVHRRVHRRAQRPPVPPARGPPARRPRPVRSRPSAAARRGERGPSAPRRPARCGPAQRPCGRRYSRLRR